MEIEGTDGSKIQLKPGSTSEFGRGLGFISNDRTVSRRQILFKLEENESKVNFEVTGRNPIWVYSKKNDKVEIFRKSDKGEMLNGDMFCVSANKPIWFTLKRIEFVDENKREMVTQLAESLESSGKNMEVDLEVEDVDISSIDPVKESILIKGVLRKSCKWRGSWLRVLKVVARIQGLILELEDVDISGIDPFKEFGFLVMGHEFNGYPKRMIREIKNWNWFIEEDVAESDADEDSDRKDRKNARRKRKKKGKGDDEEWTGESEDEKELLTRSKKLQKPKYMTRSKEKSSSKTDKRSTQQKSRSSEQEYEEDDETLGGFIVDNVEDEPEVGDEDEEEEVDADEDDEELED